MNYNELNAEKPNWCPGCGNNIIFIALKNALTKLNIDPNSVVLTLGIGCHGHMVNFLDVNGFEGLHGRPLPLAEGAKMANKNLNIISITGDGDCLGEGLNHFISACRGNQNVTCIIHDNQIYGLTTGQTSPTSQKGFKSKSTPTGSIEVPINPMLLAISVGGTFVSRSFAGDMNHLTDTIVQAISHNGFSVVDALQPCVTFNKINTFEWFKEHTYKLEKGYDSKDKLAAINKAMESDKLPIGVLYQEDRASYQDELPQIKELPLVHQDLSNIDISPLMEKLR